MSHKHNRKEKGLSLFVFALGIAGILGFAALAIDFGISNNVQNELQKATNTAALAGALYMEADPVTGKIDQTKAKNEALKAFQKSITDEPLISNAVIVNIFSGAETTNDPNAIQTILTSREVRIQAKAQSKTYFMAVIGIYALEINAQAAAINAPIFPERANPAPSGSIISSDIKDPIGGNKNLYKLSNGMDPQAGFILGQPDNIPVALGPGGSITLKLAAPIIDGPGPDVVIKELGDLKGYYVYVGREVGNGSYEWANVSCTGKPSPDQSAAIAPGAYVDSYGQYKYYGTGYFDLSGVCSCPSVPNAKNYTGKVKSATLIRVIDDNVEDGILTNDLNTVTTMFGDHSSTAPGANIDYIAALHHSKSIDFDSKDTDSDGLVDAYEKIIGTATNNQDTDGDGLTDGDEISLNSGYETNPRVADTDGDGVTDKDEITSGTNPLVPDKDKI